MITKEQAMAAKKHDEFVIWTGNSKRVARVNGACQVWSRRPHMFRLPMRYRPLRGGSTVVYFVIDQDNAHLWSARAHPHTEGLRDIL